MENTAIMEAIENHINMIKTLKLLGQSGITMSAISAHEYSIQLLQSLLPKEREQIEKAYQRALPPLSNSEILSELYFNQTYGETK